MIRQEIILRRKSASRAGIRKDRPILQRFRGLPLFLEPSVVSWYKG